MIDIIRHPQFKIEDVVPNSRKFRKYRQRLPILPMKSQKISISSKKMPFTSKNIGEAYYLSISDILWHILNNPSLFNTMYFGPGQEMEKAKSFGMEISGRNLQDLDKHLSQLCKVTLGKTKLFSVVKNNLLIFMILFIGKFSFQFSANICFIEIYYSGDFIIYREPSSYEGIFIVSSSSNSVISFCFEQRI